MFYFFLNTYHVHNNKISIFYNEIEKIIDIQNVMCTLHVHVDKSFDNVIIKSLTCDSD